MVVRTLLKPFFTFVAVAFLGPWEGIIAEETEGLRKTKIVYTDTKYPIRYVHAPSGTNYCIRTINIPAGTNFIIRVVDK